MVINQNTITMPVKTDREVPIVSFIGSSGSGKTTLLEAVIRELKGRRYRVAAIKHSHHSFEIDQPGKDTWRLAQAGSDIVAISAPGKVAFIERVDDELPLSQIERLVASKVDIMITEGYKSSDVAKILVLGAGPGQELRHGEDEMLMTISAHFSDRGEPEFSDYDIIKVADLLVEQIKKHSHSKV